jgi:glycosyltransferase A (GT-A) superfamily protein (DUF2064 family)
VSVQLVVLAKAPVAGSVKTRLCPPCTSEQAAAVAAAALADTLDAVSATPAVRRALILSGRCATPDGWTVLPQRGLGLAERLVHAYADTALPGTTTVLVGMDTPQLDPGLLGDVAAGLAHADAVLGPAEDGGWWTLALRDPRHATALRAVSMSTPDTYDRTVRALRARGLSVATAPMLRDVDTAEDAWAVAQIVPDGRFAQAVTAHVPGHSRQR